MSQLKNRAFTFGLCCIFVLPMSAMAQWTVGTGAGDYTVTQTNSGRVPFRIDPGANAGAIFIDQDGDTALGTTTPLNDFNSRLYIADLTPDIAFEDENLEQIWSFYANGDSIGFCDETNYPQPGGTTVPCSPFFIQTGAPLASLAVAENGYVGVGVQSPPEVNLHVAGDSVGPVEELFRLESTTSPQQVFLNSTSGAQWFFAMTSTDEFKISLAGTGKVEARFRQNGDLRIAGAYQQISDRNSKKNINNARIMFLS